MTPFSVKHKLTGDSQPVPCGKCPDCVKARISQWSFRLVKHSQDKSVTSAAFITLTYDTLHVPITRNGFMGLDKRHLQLFFKRLRKAHERYSDAATIKYFAVGEYGGRTNRPHYHVILFNARTELIQPAWGMGHIDYGDQGFSGASVGYALKYITKPSKIPLHRNDDRLPEFSVQSKGLGLNYVTEAMIKWHTTDLQNRMYCALEDGRKIAMPRYYKDKIYNEAQRKAAGYAAQSRFIKQFEKTLVKDGDYLLISSQAMRNKAEADIQAFKRMHHRSTLNQTL